MFGKIRSLGAPDIQSAPDNSNLPGKSKKVRVIGSSKQTTRSKENGWGINASNMHTLKLDKYIVMDTVF